MDATMAAAAPGAPSVGTHRDSVVPVVADPAAALALPGGAHGPEADGEPDEAVTDSRRTWSPEMLLELAKIYKQVALANPDLGRMGVMQLVYDEFKKVVDCSSRSRKAVDDKLYSMKQMYHFIMKMNGNFKLGYRKSVPTWFELSKEERRAVRSLHRVRTPNISLEVFRLLDSVLNPNPNAFQESEDASAPASGSPTSVVAADGGPAAASPGVIPDVVDAKRNWSDDVTLELAKAWNAVHQQHPELRGAMLSHQVYNAFMTTVGFSNRSRKAVDDKMHSMREMYRFVRTYEAQREAGENKPGWFDLTKKERREMRARHKIRVTNLSREVYEEIDQVMSRSSLEPGEDESPNAASAETVQPSTPSSGAQDVDTSTELHPPSAQAASAQVPSTQAPSVQASSAQTPSVQAPSLPVTSALVQVASQPANLSVTPPVPIAPSTAQASRSAQALPAAAVLPNVSATSVPSTIVVAENAPESASEPPAKRRRIQPDLATSSESSSSIAQAVCEQIRLMHEQDREERRRQHAEQMAVLREIASLLRQKP